MAGRAGVLALNIDTPKRWEDLPKREAITREILRNLGAIPFSDSAEGE